MYCSSSAGNGISMLSFSKKKRNLFTLKASMICPTNLKHFLHQDWQAHGTYNTSAPFCIHDTHCLPTTAHGDAIIQLQNPSQHCASCSHCNPMILVTEPLLREMLPELALWPNLLPLSIYNCYFFLPLLLIISPNLLWGTTQPPHFQFKWLRCNHSTPGSEGGYLSNAQPVRTSNPTGLRR